MNLVQALRSALPLLREPRYLPLNAAFAVALIAGATLLVRDGDQPFTVAAFLAGAALSALGVSDMRQTSHSILRNYPIAAHLRFLFEDLRPAIRQYFFEDDHGGAPFSRDKRAVVYQRAKHALDKRPFGTTHDVYAEGFEWVTHSMAPAPLAPADFRTTIGGFDGAKSYSMSLFNISAMSFGALSANAIQALNKGALMGGFAHDTGEGGYSPHHSRFGGDIVWEIGSGYFGARHEDGGFSPERFAETAANEQIKMIEVKLSQGAKPGHGGVLPGSKVSAEIARTRGVPAGVDCISPSAHSAFSTPVELMEFIATLRRLSGGKPTGFKLCIGHEWEFLALCKAMHETQFFPDFIVIDGKEGGTGAAPMEFIDHLGKPLREGLTFAHNALVGIDARHRVKLGASGKIATAFDMVRVLALGADWCNSARGFMFALGCIQSQSCHTDRCPTGVATQDPGRQRALVVPDKARRVANYHSATLHSLAELTAAAGLTHPGLFSRGHVQRRISPREVASFADIYPVLEPGALLVAPERTPFARAWAMADARTFQPQA
ncbi:MAG: ferredoxin-dependent glutamate synthase [Hyphomicrobiales bacterium]|nr:ferredoxin-dependent glutamate synthase [Hyphomicrobiales bacterium]